MAELILAISLCERLPSFNPKGFLYSHARSHSLCEGRASFCSGLISRKLCKFLVVFDWLYFTQCLTSFSSINHLRSLCMVISPNIDDFLLINPSTNVFVFGDFNVHHKDWLTYFSGTDRPGELCYNFSISNDLTQMVNFPTRIPD